MTLRVNLQKYVTWALGIWIIYLLRHLFPVIFLTFILSYIGNTAVNHLQGRIHYRRLSLVFVYVIFLLVLTGVLGTLLPTIYAEASDLARQYVGSLDVEKPRVEAAEPRAAQKRSRSSRTSPLLYDYQRIGPLPDTTTDTASASSTMVEKEIQKLYDRYGGNVLGVEAYDRFKKTSIYQDILTKTEGAVMEFVPRIVENVKSGVNNLFALILQFFLAVLFSFLILWDLPGITERVKAFRSGPTAEIYEALSPAIRTLGVMLGKAFEAQTGIACLNTCLTSVGFWVLGIPSISLLAMIVFFCSYIPVLGVVLSTLPAGLLAFKVGGFAKILWVTVMVLIAHAVEAYGLNPLIYGHHMRMHPVLVLVVLMIGEHLLGVWGLLLAVPMTAFFVKFVLKGETVE